MRFFSTTTALVRPWLKLCLTVPVSLPGRFTPKGGRGGVPVLKVFPVVSLLSVINRLIIRLLVCQLMRPVHRRHRPEPGRSPDLFEKARMESIGACR